jgi:hypothetical protein
MSGEGLLDPAQLARDPVAGVTFCKVFWQHEPVLIRPMASGGFPWTQKDKFSIEECRWDPARQARHSNPIK